jgi:hypothetical protein
MSLSTNAHFERGIHPVQGFHVSRVPAPWRQAGRIAHLRSRRIFAVSIALGVTLAAGVAGPAMATGNGPLGQPQSLSRADVNTGGANGQCPTGPYCSTRNGSPSLNGNGNGGANGKPCAGCVGKADNKNPPGQMPNGSDHNAGYECDRNHGIGASNPAHTGCASSVPPTTVTPPVVKPPVVKPPVVKPPVVKPPVVKPPVVKPPVVKPPVVKPPVVKPPVVKPPVVKPPVVKPPVVKPPVVNLPPVAQPVVVPPAATVGTETSDGVQVAAAKPVVKVHAGPVVTETSDAVQVAAAHPVPSAARAGEANTSGQLTAGGFAALAALLAFGSALVLRRRHGDA